MAFGPIEHPYREPTWWRFAVALTVAVGGLLGLMDGVLRSTDSASLGIYVGFVALLAGAIASIVTARAPRFREKTGVIEVRNGAPTVDGRMLLNTTSTAIELDGDVYRVSIFEGARYPRFVVTTYSYEEAKSFCDAIAIKDDVLPSYRVAGFSTVAGRAVFALGLVAVGAGGILAIMLGVATWFLLTLVGLVMLRIPGRATIGADGIVLSCLGVETFVPFADVVRVERDYGVVLHRRDGSTLRLREAPGDAVVDKMLARIEEVRRATLDTQSTERLLERGDRTEEAWRDELQRLALPAYRQAAIERERLWEVFENPGAEASARLGAAILLRTDASADDTQRLVRVSAAVASPELRDQLAEEEGERSATLRS